MLSFILLIRLLCPPIETTTQPQVQEVITQRAIFYHNPMSEPDAHLLAEAVLQESGVIGVPLILAVIESESRYSRKAKSKRGCKGLMQLAKGTARSVAKRLGKSKFDVFDIKTNITLGVNYLTSLVADSGSIEKALTIYNRGWKSFIEHGRKTSGYALTIIKRAKLLQQLLIHPDPYKNIDSSKKSTYDKHMKDIKVSSITLITTKNNSDLLYLHTDLPEPTGCLELGKTATLTVKAARGFGKEWCHKSFGQYPNKVIEG